MHCIVAPLAFVGFCALMFLFGWVVKFFIDMSDKIGRLERRAESSSSNCQDLSSKYWELTDRINKLDAAGRK